MENVVIQNLIANRLVAITLLVAITAVICVIAVKIMQTIGMEKVRKYVYAAFVDAENRFMQGQNADKFEYVISVIKPMIPAPFNFFITESFLRKVVQLWFDLVKDLLDNGRVDASVKRKSTKKTTTTN